MAVALLAVSGCQTFRSIKDNWFASQQVKIAEGGHGSGVVIHESGILLTCHHVADKPGESTLEITIVEGDGEPRKYQAKVLAYDPDLDISAIKIDRQFSTPAILESPENLHIDLDVYNIGYPYSLGKVYGKGYIMKLHVDAELGNDDEPIHLRNGIMIHLPGGHGTSGSGVFNAENGKLVGIVKLIHPNPSFNMPLNVVHYLSSVEDVKKFLDKNKIPYHNGHTNKDWSLNAGESKTPVIKIQIPMTIEEAQRRGFIPTPKKK
jgi:S1-C subfamily serine protease